MQSLVTAREPHDARLIGIDLDNTIIDYRECLHAIGLREGMISADVPAQKSLIRDRLRGQPGGEDRWRRLQALAYGREIGRAKMMTGALEFVKECQKRGIKVVIVSHKSERATADPDGPDLRTCAIRWLADNGFFADDTGLSAERVFFGATRREKVTYIRDLGCTEFIDDLPETFEDPTFPDGVRRLLFTCDSGSESTVAVNARGSWSDFVAALTAEGSADSGDSRDAAEAAASELLGVRPDRLLAVTGGRNSRVFQVSAKGEQFALKQYFQSPGDQRDRLRTEFEAVTLMRSAGVTNVPAAIELSVVRQCALYQWIDGARIPVGESSASEIDDAVRFLGNLRVISVARGKAWTTNASEARFSVADVVANIKQRLDAIERSPSANDPRSDLGAFLRERLGPVATSVVATAKGESAAIGIGYENELPPADRTLSPSDFGFHNALRTSGGELAFVDFEYFGWDDPAKGICDFVLHPAMQLSHEHKRRFARGMFGAFRDVPLLQKRVALLYPLFGLKWVLILLNEFLPEHLLRRGFAGLLDGGHDVLLSTQLAKAAALLSEIEVTTGKFPYA